MTHAGDQTTTMINARGHVIEKTATATTDADVKQGTVGAKKEKAYNNKHLASVKGSRGGNGPVEEGATTHTEVTASMFAGAKAGGDFKATVQWKSPEKDLAFVDLAMSHCFIITVGRRVEA